MADELALRIVRRYAQGAQVADLAAEFGQDQQRLGLALADLCGLNRNRAAELVRTGAVLSLLDPPQRRHGRVDLPANVSHGTEGAYRWHGCRCALCKNGRAERRRNQAAEVREAEDAAEVATVQEPAGEAADDPAPGPEQTEEQLSLIHI